MLIYLASYPRSGNTLVANTIAHYFRVTTSSAYRGEGRGHGEVELLPDGAIGKIFSEYVDGESGRTVRVLLDGSGPYLTDELRMTLADDDETFFLKTHEAPFARYFEGERVVHIVRHPGAVCWSYWHYIAHERRDSPLSLEDVVEGRVFPGSWTRHATRWLSASEGLGERYQRLRYEDILQNAERIVDSVSRLTGLKLGKEAGTFPGFDFWHAVSPDFYRSGKPDEWTDHFTLAQEALLWALHGQTMGKLGYSVALSKAPSSGPKEGNLPGLAGEAHSDRDHPGILEALRDHIQRLAQSAPASPSSASRPAPSDAATAHEVESKQAAIDWLKGELANKQRGLDWLAVEAAGKQKGMEWLQGELARKQTGIAWLERELASERERVRLIRLAFQEREEKRRPPEKDGWLKSALVKLRWRAGPASPRSAGPAPALPIRDAKAELPEPRPGGEIASSTVPLSSNVVRAVASSAPSDLLSDEALRAAVRKYPFYHIIQLTESVSTQGNPHFLPIQQQVLDTMRAMPWQGKKVLDIGTRDGLFALEAEKLGAATVIGVDNAISRGAVELVLPALHSHVAMYEGNLFDLRRETFGPFDVVLFAGVLYHLRYPFWGLKVVRDLLVDGGTLLLETALWRGQPDMAALWCPTESESPYESTSVSFFNEKGLRDTLASLGFVVLSFSTLPTGSDSVVKTKWGGITRACFVCRFVEGAQSPRLRGYWDGLHSEH